MKSLVILFFSVFILTSCAKIDADFEPQTETDILKYIKDNNLNASKTSSGLYYVITKEGTGNMPTSNTSNVTVAYNGYFLNGNVFDKNETGYTTNLNQVIAGWTEGLQLFKEGGEGVLIVPYQLGYGINKYGPIPGGSVLVFDIKLISVN